MPQTSIAPDAGIESDVSQLLCQARQSLGGEKLPKDWHHQDGSNDNSQALGRLLQLYRNYLTILATTQLDRRLRRRMSPSDLVQDAMLAAHRDFRSFRGSSEPELLCWLRQILVNCLRDAIDMHLNAQKRDLRREVSIEQVGQSLDKSACQLANVLADRGPSPSEPARRRERAVELADQLAKLRPEYRDVIVLRNLQGLSFNEIAERLDRRPGTVRMLWLRAMDKFKQTYEQPQA
ncbi:sigma-70 family RNA polymerase sigma factor [Stieleria maiorica]|nr:sigma-70 family RNA polymerase sigma factor [Stieleria maiorica]